MPDTDFSKGRPTIHHVAEKVGLSVATVSRALSGYKHVNEQTRKRVEKAAEELGYQPNGLAQALRREQTSLVGLIVPDVRSEFFAAATAVIQLELERHGYRLVLGVSHDDAEVDRSFLIEFVQQRVDGIIHAPCTEEGAAFLGSIASAPPVVEINRRSSGGHADSVHANNRAGVAELTEHLISLGHRRLALIAGRPEVSTARERTQGFLEVVEKAGVADLAQVAAKEYSVEWGRSAARSLLEAPDPPTAIIATSTQLTTGALLCMRELGLDVPGDVSLGGFDDPDWYRACRPALTTYADPLREMSRMATELLLRRLDPKLGEDEPRQPINYTLSGELRVRESTGAPPAANAQGVGRKPSSSSVDSP